jgi:hypothetical protein
MSSLMLDIVESLARLAYRSSSLIVNVVLGILELCSFKIPLPSRPVHFCAGNKRLVLFSNQAGRTSDPYEAKKHISMDDLGLKRWLRTKG